MTRFLVSLVIALVLSGPTHVAAAAHRNRPALPSNAGEQSPFGFDPQLIEVQFCGAPVISAAELQQFQATYQLTFDHITPAGGQANVVYLFRIQSGTPPEKVRQVAQDLDVAAASVESLGHAALPSPSATPSASPKGLPSTATTQGPGGPGSQSDPAAMNQSWLVLLVVALFALALTIGVIGKRARR